MKHNAALQKKEFICAKKYKRLYLFVFCKTARYGNMYMTF